LLAALCLCILALALHIDTVLVHSVARLSSARSSASIKLGHRLDAHLLDEGWSKVVQDWLLPFHPEITSADIDDSLRLDPGRKVVFQHIKGDLFISDPNSYCLSPSPDKSFIKDRCFAIYSILRETALAASGRLPDFEFVYDFEDFPAYRSSSNTRTHKSMPGFGAVRCWQKGFMSFPMFASHGKWDIKDVDAKIAGILGRRPKPFAERNSTAVFRGGIRTCSFPPEHNSMRDWETQEFNEFYKGAPCGRLTLDLIGREHPDLVDFKNTDLGGAKLSMADRRLIQVHHLCRRTRRLGGPAVRPAAL